MGVSEEQLGGICQWRGGEVRGVLKATSPMRHREEGPWRLLGGCARGFPERDKTPGRMRAAQTCHPVS